MTGSTLQPDDHLWLSLYLLKPTASESVCTRLHSILSAVAPRWCNGLSVLKHDDDRRGLRVREQTLLQAMELKAPLRAGMGSWTLCGAYRGVSLYLNSARTTHAPEVNTISIEIYRLLTVEDHSASRWLFECFRALAKGLPVRYAYAHADPEFDASNMEKAAGSAQAIGRDFHSYLPGLYWLNYFGPEYAALLGLSTLLSAPAQVVERHGDGVLLAIDTAPHRWRLPEYQSRKEAILQHLGQEFFFDRHSPNRPHRAPDFYAKTTQT